MGDALEDAAESPIQQFYTKRSIFVTGGTGFIGKLLLEKLLRCCPDIERVYVLIRTKKGKSPEQRLQELFEKPCFGPLKEKFPMFRDKVIPVIGDTIHPLCGISNEDLEILKRDVSIVFNSAANVQFFAHIRKAIEVNMLGTRHVLELCKQLPLLEAFVHVSTAFARREPDFTCPEDIGDYHAKPKDVLSLLKVLDDDSLELVAPSLLKDVETIYQVSKTLAEVLLEEEKENVPVSIIRPSLTVSTWKEPLPGWTDTYQTLSTLDVAVFKGFLRALWMPSNCRIYLIPVDVAVNAMIAVAWYQAARRIKSPFVVNCAMKFEDSPNAGNYTECAFHVQKTCPLSNIYRYPDFTWYTNKWLCYIHAIVDHYIPAVIIDALLFLSTGKTLMVSLYRKLGVVLNVAIIVGSSPWRFQVENFNKVKSALSSKDAEVFFMSMDTFDVKDFTASAVLGERTFLHKDDPSTIPYAIKKGQIWWFVTTFLKWCLILFFIYCFIPEKIRGLHGLKFIEKPDGNI